MVGKYLSHISVSQFKIILMILFFDCFEFYFHQCDLSHREVEQNKIEEMCKEHDFVGWTETSVKEGQMIDESMRYSYNYSYGGRMFVGLQF